MVSLGVGLVVILQLFVTAYSDVYLHSPRGGNNRNNENSRDRNNANRLFDSQNNARGGYNVGNLYYLTGSTLNIEWTNQHSCNDPNANCDIILQYMYSNELRDGSSTATIPENPSECTTRNSDGVVSMDCNSMYEYGMHENFYYYHECKQTKRNDRLYTADQNLRNKYSAIYTRQNKNGNRHGYECPEERDYYPYWNPSPWVDIAVLTDNVTRCQMYQNESQNVKPRFKCDVPYQYLYQMAIKAELPELESQYIPITEEECLKFNVTYTDENGNPVTKIGKWIQVSSHGVAAPECHDAPWSRDNHNGNGVNGQHNTFNWTVPSHLAEHVVLRIRYNISTGELPWDADYMSNGRMRDAGPDIYSQHGLTEEQASERGYKVKNNPLVDVFNTEADSGNKKFKLQLAFNTAQNARTFQDRSHRFAIRQRPEGLECSNILNLNVRGKRGNIVQVYPAVEYDFTPNTARVKNGDCIHPQWTGSDNNNPNNDGQGRRSTDRSNIVPLSKSIYSNGPDSTYGAWGRVYPTNTLKNSFFPEDVMINAAILASNQMGGDMDELDDAGTYFDLGPQKVTMIGTHHYMCTRNNNFSNRSQKGKFGKSTSIFIEPGSLNQAHNIQLEHHPMGHNPIGSEPSNTDYVSGFVSLAPALLIVRLVGVFVGMKHRTLFVKFSMNKLHRVSSWRTLLHGFSDGHEKITVEDKYILMSIELDIVSTGLFHRHVYRTTDGETWHKLEILPDVSSERVVSFHTDTGGHFVASRSVAPGPLAGLIVGLLVGIVLVVLFVYFCRANKLPLAGYNSKI